MLTPKTSRLLPAGRITSISKKSKDDFTQTSNPPLFPLEGGRSLRIRQYCGREGRYFGVR